MMHTIIETELMIAQGEVVIATLGLLGVVLAWYAGLWVGERLYKKQ